MTTEPRRDPPTNREVVRLLQRVLEELAEVKRGQRQLSEALERASPTDA